MRINHSDAIELESIVRQVHQCDRGGMGGCIDADYFEHAPYDASLIALAPLWKQADNKTIEEFLCRWDYAIRKDRNANIREYIQELDELVDGLLRYIQNK